MKLLSITKQVGSESLAFYPVQSDLPGSENQKFFMSTPSGEIKLFVCNPKATADLEIGAEYYVDFTVAK